MALSNDPVLASASFSDFCRRLADATPTPAGGSLAAGLGAMGASLASMALRGSFGEREIYQVGRADELDVLRARVIELVDRDSVALAKVLEAKAQGASGGLQPALRGALEPPFETMEVCLAALRLTAVGAPDVADDLAADALCAAHSLWAGLENAYLMVRANADAIEDADFVQDRVGSADAMRVEAAKLLVEVRGFAEKARA